MVGADWVGESCGAVEHGNPAGAAEPVSELCAEALGAPAACGVEVGRWDTGGEGEGERTLQLALVAASLLKDFAECVSLVRCA